MASIPRKSVKGANLKKWLVETIDAILDYLHTSRIRPGYGIAVDETPSGIVVRLAGNPSSNAPVSTGGGGTTGATGIESSVSGGTASVTLTGGTGAVHFRGSGTVEIQSVRANATQEEIEDWGRRYNPETGEMDGDYKNAGWRGIIPLENGDVMTEYGMSSEIDGVEVGYPLIVPDTTDEELAAIEQAILQNDDSLIPQSALDKALDWAESRLLEGKDPFYNGDAEDDPLRVIDDSIIIHGSTTGGGGGAVIGFPDYLHPLVTSVQYNTTYPGTAYADQNVWLIGMLNPIFDPNNYALPGHVEITFTDGTYTNTILVQDIYMNVSSNSNELETPVMLPIPAGIEFRITYAGNSPGLGVKIYPCL